MRLTFAKGAAPSVLLLALLGCPLGSDPLEPPRELRVVGHRGASGLAPENTLAALARARAVGAREVEVDAQLSRDGVVVLFHDARLGRKTSLRGDVAHHDWESLRRAEIGRWFHQSHPQVPGSYEGTALTSLS